MDLHVLQWNYTGTTHVLAQDQKGIPLPVSGLEFCKYSATTCQGNIWKSRSDSNYEGSVFRGKQLNFKFEGNQCEEDFIKGWRLSCIDPIDSTDLIRKVLASE